MFCRSLFVLLYFYFWSLCCLFFLIYGFWLPLWYLQTLHTIAKENSLWITQVIVVTIWFQKHVIFFRSAEYIKSNLVSLVSNKNSNMTSLKRFESKPVVKIIYIYTHCNLWRHRQFITLFYQFLHIRIEIIHGSHMYILFLPRVGLYVSFLSLACARGKTSWYKGLPVVKTIYTHGFHELFLKQTCHSIANQME
jgi:hypothetical protein